MAMADTCRTSETDHSFATDNEACAAPKNYSKKDLFDKLRGGKVMKPSRPFSVRRSLFRRRFRLFRRRGRDSLYKDRVFADDRDLLPGD